MEVERTAPPVPIARQNVMPAPLRLPRGPVLGWDNFAGSRAPGLPAVDDLAHAVLTTSGRAALYLALRELGPVHGACVLVPTYHCPTMVAPVLLAGCRPLFYALDDAGLPDLKRLAQLAAERPLALIVAHYFGLPRSLADVRQWCDTHGVVLIEDCAHCLFGWAGERPVGHWGDYATASLSKFLPVPEAGVLASATRPLSTLVLQPRRLSEQLKGVADVLELGVRHGRLPGLNGPLGSIVRWRRGSLHPVRQSQADLPPADAAAMMHGCDMGRANARPLWVSRWMARALPRERVVLRRRQHYARYAHAFSDRSTRQQSLAELPPRAAPYVYPLWVDDADRVYRRLRALEAPVFRWDRIWPGTPDDPSDCGPRWSHHILQLLCHQDLDHEDVDRVIDTLRTLLQD